MQHVSTTGPATMTATVVSSRHILRNSLVRTLEPTCVVETAKAFEELLSLDGYRPAERVLIIEQTVSDAACMRSAVALFRKGVIAWLPSISPEVALASLESGARGVLGDDCSEADVLRCVDTVNKGGSWVPSNITNSLLTRPACRLTTREAQLVTLLASGLRNKEIAWSLGITEGTVKVYLSKIFDKLGVSDRFELALFALRTMGLLPHMPQQEPAQQSQPAASLQLIPRRVFPLKPRLPGSSLPPGLIMNLGQPVR